MAKQALNDNELSKSVARLSPNSSKTLNIGLWKRNGVFHGIENNITPKKI